MKNNMDKMDKLSAKKSIHKINNGKKTIEYLHATGHKSLGRDGKAIMDLQAPKTMGTI